MGDIDLTAFCASNFLGEFDLSRPFSRGEFSYATNGHIAVRVPRRQDVPEDKESPDVAKVFALVEPLPPTYPLSFKRPKPTAEECVRCDGSGKKHACPDCKCRCEECDGTGKFREYTVGIGGAVFDGKYIERISRLPKPEFAVAPEHEQPAYFKFEGGDGVLMPMRSRRDLHVVATAPDAAGE